MQPNLRSTDVHEAARRMAHRIVAIFEAVLMDHEKPEALYQAFLVAKEGIEEFERGKT